MVEAQLGSTTFFRCNAFARPLFFVWFSYPLFCCCFQAFLSICSFLFLWLIYDNILWQWKKVSLCNLVVSKFLVLYATCAEKKDFSLASWGFIVLGRGLCMAASTQVDWWKSTQVWQGESWTFLKSIFLCFYSLNTKSSSSVTVDDSEIPFPTTWGWCWNPGK